MKSLSMGHEHQRCCAIFLPNGILLFEVCRIIRQKHYLKEINCIAVQVNQLILYKKEIRQITVERLNDQNQSLKDVIWTLKNLIAQVDEKINSATKAARLE